MYFWKIMNVQELSSKGVAKSTTFTVALYERATKGAVSWLLTYDDPGTMIHWL